MAKKECPRTIEEYSLHDSIIIDDGLRGIGGETNEGLERVVDGNQTRNNNDLREIRTVDYDSNNNRCGGSYGCGMI